MYVFSSFLKSLGQASRECCKHIQSLPQTGFHGARVACRETLIHHLNPINGIRANALKRIEASHNVLLEELDVVQRRLLRQPVERAVRAYEFFVYKPVILPILNVLCGPLACARSPQAFQTAHFDTRL